MSQPSMQMSRLPDPNATSPSVTVARMERSVIQDRAIRIARGAKRPRLFSGTFGANAVRAGACYRIGRSSHPHLLVATVTGARVQHDR
jgi:hypothetical protein